MIIFACGGQNPVLAQTPEGKPSRLQGFDLQGEFYRQFYSVKDPLRQYGYPISNQIPGSTLGTTYQYFQKARFELKTTASGTVIEITPLASMLFKDLNVTPSSIENSGPTCRFFSKSGFNVCYGFRNYYDKYEGDKTLGEPISGLFELNGRTGQCFEKACLEWRDNLPTGEKVVILDLGRVAFDQFEGIRLPSINYNTTGKNVPMRVSSFTYRALINPKEQQLITTIVTDLNGKPINGAQVQAVIIHPDGKEEPMPIVPDTNSSGISQFPMSVNRWEPGQVVQVLIKVTYNGETRRTATWFRLWY